MSKTTPSPETVARRSSPAYIRARITGQYLGLYLLALILGVLLCALLDADVLPDLRGRAAAHFTSPFVGVEGLPARAEALLDAASGDIRAMLVIALTSLTLFCPPALCIFTVWRGFSLGFVAAWLGRVLPTTGFGAGAFLLFVGQSGLVAAAFVQLCAEAVIFSHQYRAVCGRPRKIIRSPFVWRYLFGYLTMFGFVILTHAISGGLCGML